jgi:hypothetical protein
MEFPSVALLIATHLAVSHTLSGVCAKCSTWMGKFEGLLCGAKDEIIDEVLQGQPPTIAAMHDGMTLLLIEMESDRSPNG